MARALRIEQPGGWYHLTARGNERKAIYLDDADRRHFCELLAETVARFRMSLHVYVLMGNHYHLMVELAETNLSRAMQWLNVIMSVTACGLTAVTSAVGISFRDATRRWWSIRWAGDCN